MKKGSVFCINVGFGGLFWWKKWEGFYIVLLVLGRGLFWGAVFEGVRTNVFSFFGAVFEDVFECFPEVWVVSFLSELVLDQ